MNVLQQINVKPVSKMINNMINNAGSFNIYNKTEAIKYKYVYTYIQVNYPDAGTA